MTALNRLIQGKSGNLKVQFLELIYSIELDYDIATALARQLSGDQKVHMVNVAQHLRGAINVVEQLMKETLSG